MKILYKSMNYVHEDYIRRCYELAINAGKKGYDTFGAILVYNGEIIAEAENTREYDNEIRGHAEFRLIYQSIDKFPKQILEKSVVYTSCAPCARCLMAIVSAGIQNIVYGVSYKCFQQLLPVQEELPDYELLLNRMNIPIKMIGPILEDEGMAVFEYWDGEHRQLDDIIKLMKEIREKKENFEIDD